MVALERSGRPSLFTRMSAGVMRHTVTRFPRLTTTVANSVGYVMTAPLVAGIVRSAIGRGYDIGAARRMVFPNVDKDRIGVKDHHVYIISPENEEGKDTISISSAAAKWLLRAQVTSWAEWRGESHFYGGGWIANAYTPAELRTAFWGSVPLSYKTTPAILRTIEARNGDVASEPITAGMTRIWPK